jgi:dTDP-4-dehydrorhamnose reductase
MMRFRRVMVTGASGLLGTAVLDMLRGQTEVFPLAHQHGRDGMRPVDLMDPAQLAGLGRDPWDALVHCAAFRSPDFCEQDPTTARRLNAEVPVALARLARARGARMIHVSTDYVFPGTHPPYLEDSPREAVNVYGQTKIEAEEGLESVYPAAVILRIGALYGIPTRQVPSPMLQEALDAAYASEPQALDDRIVRCPSLVADVARAIGFLLGSEARGIVHASARSTYTRYAWTRLVARTLGLSEAHLQPTDRDLARPARRPVNSLLQCERLLVLGGPLPRDAEQVLPGLAGRLRRG